MKKLTIAGAVLVLAFALIAGPAMAQPPGGQGGQGRRGGMGSPPSFEDLDANKDGKVSRDEFRGPERMFDRMDGDGDGSLTSEEFQPVRQRFQEGGGFGMGPFDPEQFQQRMLEMYKGMLGSSDEEWQVLEPLVKNVMDAQHKERMASFGGFGFGFMGGPGGPGGGPGGPAPGMANQDAKEIDTLRQALENPNTPAETLQERLAALREARKQTTEALKQARDTLREVLTVRQEAQLVLTGLLE